MALTKADRSEPTWMSLTLAPSPWPAAPAAAASRFGRAGSLHDAGGLQWVLRRNCSISPRQLGAFYLSLCGLSLIISAGFAWQGAFVVLAFAGLELLLVGVALLAYARHACDGDTLTLAGQWLSVEQASGPRTRLTRFRAQWVRVEPSAVDGSLVELSGEGQRVRIGRFVRPELRSDLAREIRTALRDARAQAPEPEASNR